MSACELFPIHYSIAKCSFQWNFFLFAVPQDASNVTIILSYTSSGELTDVSVKWSDIDSVRSKLCACML